MQIRSFQLTNARRDRVAHHFGPSAAMLAGAALAAGLALLSGRAAAQAPDAMTDCTAIEDDAERLECFDRLTRAEQPKPPAAPESPPAPATQPETPAATAEPPVAETREPAETPRADAEAPVDDFGLERKRELVGPDRFLASVVGGFQGWGGYEKTVFVLDNGQVWEQVGFEKFRYGGPDRVVEIRRGALGSFLLSPEGLNRKVRVRRLK